MARTVAFITWAFALIATTLDAMAASEPPTDVRAILAAAQPVSVDEATANWRPLHYKIYATKGEPMGIQETRETLDQLIAIYERQLGTSFADKNMPARLEKLKQLAATNKVGRSTKCEQMSELNALIEYNQPFQVNVVPLVRQNRRRLFAFCGDFLYKQAEEALKVLSGTQDEALVGKDFLEIMVERPKLEELTGSEDALAPRVNEILELRNHISGDKAAKRAGDKTFESYYDELVRNSCSVFEKKLRKPVVEDYHLLGYGLDLFEPQSQLRKWLRYSRVCLDLVECKKAIMSRARLVFQDKYTDGPIRGR